MRYFELRQVLDPATGVVRVRVTGYTIAQKDVILLEPDGRDGYRVKASTSSGPMSDSERETALGYVRAALAERALGGFGKTIRWSEILAKSSA